MPSYLLPPSVNIDMTRVLTAVLLQETQPLDSKGEATIASTYTSWSVLSVVWVGGGEGWGEAQHDHIPRLYLQVFFTIVKVPRYKAWE